MNLGIRDGIERGRAISEHLFDSPSASPTSDPDAPLEKFASSRKAMGLETITLTKKLTWVASMQSSSLVARMRNTFFLLVGLTEFVRRRFVSELSGFGND
jgi:2-polyprenyl-6-methoxyphenol hydroxylase-like FAD-dependent oxidoreductase